MTFVDSVRSRTVASQFFKIFKSVYPELDFALMDEWEPIRRKFDVGEATIEWERNRGDTEAEYGRYMFFGRKPAEFYAFADWHGKGTHGRWVDNVSVLFDERFWLEGLLRDMSHRAIVLLKELARLGSPLYGTAFSYREAWEKNFVERTLPYGASSREGISLTSKEGVVDLYWANYFGKPYVDIFGLDSLAKVDCFSKEDVGDGVLVVFSSDPVQWADPKTREAQEKAKAILDHGAFFDKSTGLKPNLRLGLSRAV